MPVGGEGINFSSMFAMCHSFSACFRMEAVPIGVCEEGGSRSVGISLGCRGAISFSRQRGLDVQNAGAQFVIVRACR